MAPGCPVMLSDVDTSAWRYTASPPFVAVMVQSPAFRPVITPLNVTVHIVGVEEIYRAAPVPLPPVIDIEELLPTPRVVTDEMSVNGFF